MLIAAALTSSFSKREGRFSPEGGSGTQRRKRPKDTIYCGFADSLAGSSAVTRRRRRARPRMTGARAKKTYIFPQIFLYAS